MPSHNVQINDEEDEEDMDEFDDVLNNLDKPRIPQIPPPSTSTSTRTPPHPSQLQTQPAVASGSSATDEFDMSEADFEAELARGMRDLLADLGANGASELGTNSIGGIGPSSGTGAGLGVGTSPISDQQELLVTKQLQDLFENMMKGQSIDDSGLNGLLGLGDGNEEFDLNEQNSTPPGRLPPRTPTQTKASTRVPSVLGNTPSSGPVGTGAATAGTAGLSFDETIERTMRNLKDSADRAKTSSLPSTSNDPFTNLLSQLSLDPSSLDPSLLEAFRSASADGEGDGGDIEGMLDGMMSQLMSREVLEEPLMELADKYPPYIASHPSLPAADKLKHSTQLQLIQSILAVFAEPGYTDEPEEGDVRGKERKERVGVLMGQMQELGSPPEEVMGEMPAGFDFGGMGGEGCTIM